MKLYDVCRSALKHVGERRVLFEIELEPEVSDEPFTELRGWVLDKQEVVTLELVLDDSVVGSFYANQPRQVVTARHSEFPNSFLPGFSIFFPTERLKNIGRGKLFLRGSNSFGSAVLWQWQGGVDGEREQRNIQALHKFLSIEFERVSHSTRSAPRGMQKLSIILHTLGNEEHFKRNLKVLSTFGRESKEKLSHFYIFIPKSVSETLVQRWVSEEPSAASLPIRYFREDEVCDFSPELEAGEESLASHWVFSTREDVCLDFLEMAQFAQDFGQISGAPVLMPALYGGSSGLSGPVGVDLGEIRGRSNWKHNNQPVLGKTKNVFPVWLSTLGFLRGLGDGKGVESIKLPEDQSFDFLVDLRQPATLFNESHETSFSGAACAELQNVCDRALCVRRERVEAAKAFVFVLPSLNERAIFLKCAKPFFDALSNQGAEVFFVSDTNPAELGYVEGRAIWPLQALVAAEPAIQNGWIIATHWQTMFAAQELRYHLGLPVAFCLSKDELLEELQVTENQLPLNVPSQKELAYRSDFLPIHLDDHKFFESEEDIFSALNSANEKRITGLKQVRAVRCGVSVIVPVYNALTATKMCLERLERFLPESFEIIVVNDQSDDGTSTWLREFASSKAWVKLVEKPVNEGFIQACWSGLQAAPRANDILLLNSDVLLSKQALTLVQDAAYSRYNVALASVLSTESPNLKLSLNPGDSLDDAAEKLHESIQPKHPTVITPEGQLLYIRRWALEQYGFFDSVYGRGFCEESDMAMRLFLSGADMVVAENALVLHIRSMSFGSKTRLHQIANNRPIFDSRWARYYEPIYREFLRRDPLRAVRTTYRAQAKWVMKPVSPYLPGRTFSGDGFGRNFLTRLTPKIDLLRGVEVVFILPSMTLGGGTLSVIQHVEHLQNKGIAARIFYLKRGDNFGRPYLCPAIASSVNQLQKLDWANQKVVATFWTTAYVLKALHQQFPSIEPYYYVQDYEPWFYPEPAKQKLKGQCEETYHFGFQHVAKTPYLVQQLQERHGVACSLITPGIDHTIFYPSNSSLTLPTLGIAGMFRPSTPRRGSAECLEVMRRVLIEVPEAKIRLFGEVATLDKDLRASIELPGKCSPQQVAAIYRQSAVVVDFSTWHGFGRTCLEAMACGAVPVMTASGGVSVYAENEKNCFLVEQGDIEGAAQKIIQLLRDAELRNKMRASALSTAERFHEDAAVEDWLKIWAIDKPAPIRLGKLAANS